MDSSEHDYVLEDAAQWCARLAAPNCSMTDRRRCTEWQSAVPAHRQAFERVRRATERVAQAAEADRRLQLLAERAFAAGAELREDASEQVSARPLINSAKPSSQRRPGWRSNVSSLGQASGLATRWVQLAAAAGLACFFMLAWHIGSVNTDNAVDAAAVILEAPARSARTTTLDDGSRVHIDAGGKLRVTLTNAERRVELLNGRAYFEVAHDAQRPFAVFANGTRTVALGTKFEVQRGLGATKVTLAEGSIEVSGTTTDAGWVQRLLPGEQLDVRAAQRRVLQVNAEETISWSRGWLVFSGTALVDALQEINRYSVKQVVAADDSLLDLKVAGSFVAGDAQSVVDAIAEVLPIRVVDGGHREIILFKRYD